MASMPMKVNMMSTPRTGGPLPPSRAPMHTGGPTPPEQAPAYGLRGTTPPQMAEQGVSMSTLPRPTPDAGRTASDGSMPGLPQRPGLPPSSMYRERPVSATGLPSAPPGPVGRPAGNLFRMMSGR